jgi:hypothetical protein
MTRIPALWSPAISPSIALAISLAACGDPKLSVEELQDPNTCSDCHPKHFTQWSGSMHAYAADDPVFLAMNRRGQRETNGALGDFCINCHAPMAKQLGFTDFANFDPNALPPAARGITCYFCHNVKEVTSTHDNGLVLANDQTMRGGAKDPVDNDAHNSKYDALMDSDINKSEMCGSCHDIVVPASINGHADIALERTFAEWQGTLFASEDPKLHLSCGACHMGSSNLEPIADAPGVSARERGFHDHMFPAIDVALTPFPEMQAQAQAVQDILDPSVAIIGPAPLVSGNPQPGGICVTPEDGGVITVRMDSLMVGHSWPSGATQDRRAWLEVIAYDAGGNVVFQDGVVPPGEDPPDAVFGFWDRTFKADGSRAHFFWEVARIESKLLQAPAFPKQDVSANARFPVVGMAANIERVTARLRFNPLPYEMVDELIASGDLAPEIRDRLKTLEVGEPMVWLKATKDLANCGPPP